MVIIFICVLSILLALFITLYVTLRININNISKQLKVINENETNAKIVVPIASKEISKLSININKTIEAKEKTQAEFKRMEVELKQAIANMSHDLRTPLTSIMGYIQLIEDENITGEERSKYIEVVKKRSKSLEELISSFYEMSRLEAKEYKFDLRNLNITNTIYDVMASFYNDFTSKGIEPNIQIDDNAIMVIADENAVRRVFLNLIQNILRYGDKYICVSLKNEEGYAICKFENDAPHFNEKDINHIFDRFYTGDSTRTSKSTGLGLAITKQLVEQMGHKISANYIEGIISIEIKWKISS